MLLRRVIAHVRKQEWTAIAIDFAIVVIGVFVGIQVSNWNTQREIQQKGAIFTERLRADLLEEAWSHRYLMEYYTDVQVHAERALAALDGTSAASNDALLVSAYRATQYLYNTRRRETYDELVSTGTMVLIKDRTLRDTAMRTYNSVMYDRISQWGVDSRYREAFRMTVPVDVQRTLAKRCGDRFIPTGDYTGISDTLDYPCTTGLPSDVVEAVASSLRSNKRLAPLLRLRIAEVDTTLGELTVYNQDIGRGLRAITQDKP